MAKLFGTAIQNVDKQTKRKNRFKRGKVDKQKSKVQIILKIYRKIVYWILSFKEDLRSAEGSHNATIILNTEEFSQNFANFFF